MTNLEQIKNRLENENGLDTMLADFVNVEDYYTEEYNKAVGDGVDSVQRLCHERVEHARSPEIERCHPRHRYA